MKKLLLGIGTLSLTALPVLAVVSCSTTPTTPTLDGELKKLTSKATLNPLVTAKGVNEELSTPGSSSFDDYYTPIKLSEGFTYVYTSSVVNTTTPTTLDVILTVTQDNPAASKTKTIQITGFATSTLTAQKVLLIDKPSVIKTGTSDAAKTAIDNALKTSPDAAKAELEKYYSPIKLADGFSYAYTSSSASSTILVITLTITLNNGGKTDIDTKVIALSEFAPATTL